MSTQWDPDIYTKAWQFATRAHGTQTYGGPKEGEHLPYINHIGSVTMEVALALAASSQPYDADLAIQCALLHDVLEDTDHAYAEVESMFGISVANGVAALTKDKTLPTKPEQMRDSLARIQQQPHEVWMVKMADRITNLQPPPHYWDDEKKRAYQAEAQMIYDALHGANDHLAERLRHKISAYDSYIGAR